MDETLEPIRPITDTPHGALIIGGDVLCTPTSLCTWSEDGKKPEIYCKQPAHTLNPTCKTVNTGIGLIDCYSEKTCGGMVRPETTQKILRKKPHYIRIIQEEEERQRGSQWRLDYAWIIIIVMMVLLLLILLGYEHKAHRRRRRHYSRLNQSRKR